MDKITNYDKQQGIKQAYHGKTEVLENITFENNFLNDWEIEPQTLEANGVDTGFKILTASDDPSLFIGKPYNDKTYHPIANRKFLDLVQNAVGGAGHTIESVGSFRQRGRVFMSLRLDGLNDFTVGDRDFKAYLNFGNGHDKSSTLWVNTSNVCTICDNSFSINLMQLSNDNVSYKVKHTRNADSKLPEIAKLVDAACGVQAIFAEELKAADDKEISEDNAKAWFAAFLNPNANLTKIHRGEEKISTRTKNQHKAMFDLFKNGKGNRGKTEADVFSAVTDYYTHMEGSEKSLSNRIYSSEYGRNSERKRRALANLGLGDSMSMIYRGIPLMNEMS